MKDGSLEKHQPPWYGGFIIHGMMVLSAQIGFEIGSGGGLESARRIDGAKVKVRATNGWPCPGRALGGEGISAIR